MHFSLQFNSSGKEVTNTFMSLFSILILDLKSELKNEVGSDVNVLLITSSMILNIFQTIAFVSILKY